MSGGRSAAPQSGGGIRTPPYVVEGGLLVFHVDTGATEVGVSIPGRGGAFLPVGPDGRVEFLLPPDARGGERVIISDGRPPRPTNASVTIVAAD